MMVKKLLGDIVKTERLKRNLSQNSLAEQAHISLRTVSDIENYNANPRFETLCCLVQFLNISLDSVIFKKTEAPVDATINQILQELEQCSEEEKRIALSTLKGLLDGFHEQK